MPVEVRVVYLSAGRRGGVVSLAAVRAPALRWYDAVAFWGEGLRGGVTLHSPHPGYV